MKKRRVALKRYSSEKECRSDLNYFKSTAGKVYSVHNGELIGGLKIKSYYTSYCGDLSLCDWKSTTVNETFFGRFFTYNLKVDYANKLLKKDRWVKVKNKYKYSTIDRRNPDGRAAQMTDFAIDDYLKTLAK